MTYFSTLVFIGVTTFALLVTSAYLVQVDWTQALDLGPTLGPLFDV